MVSSLPVITDPVIIDGYTQPGASPNTNASGLGSNAVLKIELDGRNAEDGTNGLSIEAGDSTVRGLVINNFSRPINDFSGVGIYLARKGGNVVEGNFIGTDIHGAAGSGNWWGVLISNTSDNLVGGTNIGSRNVIAANKSYGIEITGALATGNLVRGNLIGTDVSGTVALGNLFDGVRLHGGAANNSIGGTFTAARNLISGNDRYGVHIESNSTTGNVVQGNFIGTDVTGTGALGNGFDGVMLDGGAMGNTIGGSVGGATNVVSGNNRYGIVLDSFATGNRIQGNFIGVDVTGVAPLGNRFHGVRILSASNNTIGGTGGNQGNVIAFNGGVGVSVVSGGGNAILSNSIFSNNGLGIDLGEDAVTANDAGDGDPGTNNLQNFPVLISATRGSITVLGTLDSIPNNVFRLEFFASAACDLSGHGEGERFLGFLILTTGIENTSFEVTLSATVDAGSFVTATATGGDDSTSEFSQCVPVT